MVFKKQETRDYLRCFITKINKKAGVVFNSSKLNSIEECENYILNLVEDLKNKLERNKKNCDYSVLKKEIDELNEEIAILDEMYKEKKKENNELNKKIDIFCKKYSDLSDNYNEKLLINNDLRIKSKISEFYKFLCCFSITVNVILILKGLNLWN